MLTGPTMFYTCPCDISSAEEWFVDLWNYSITPYFLHAIKCGIKLFGQRAEWNDPLEQILKTYPWTTSTGKGGLRKKKLRRIRPEDVGYQQNVSPCQSPVSSPLVDCKYIDSLEKKVLIYFRCIFLFKLATES